MSSSTFQLVLQIPSVMLDDFDAMVAFEDSLIVELSGLPHTVDGHEYGRGVLNFFVHTDDPVAAFEIAVEVFGPAKRAALKAAFRRIDGEDYTVLWPEGSREPFETKTI